jgi:hypothetical protein
MHFIGLSAPASQHYVLAFNDPTFNRASQITAVAHSRMTTDTADADPLGGTAPRIGDDMDCVTCLLNVGQHLVIPLFVCFARRQTISCHGEARSIRL